MSTSDPNDRGEYPLGPEPAPNPRPLDAPRVRISTSMTGHDVQPIPYARRVEPDAPAISTRVQFVLGLFSPIAAAAVTAILGGLMQAARLPNEASALFVWIMFLAFVGFTIFATVRLRWKGFLPGVLTMVLVIPLIFFVVCGVILATVVGSGGFR